jgi:hypothetical protein
VWDWSHNNFSQLYCLKLSQAHQGKEENTSVHDTHTDEFRNRHAKSHSRAYSHQSLCARAVHEPTSHYTSQQPQCCPVHGTRSLHKSQSKPAEDGSNKPGFLTWYKAAEAQQTSDPFLLLGSFSNTNVAVPAACALSKSIENTRKVKEEKGEEVF